MYWLNTFDSLTIPRTLGDSGSQDITLGEAPSRAMVVPGSVYDPFGTDRAPRGISRISADVLIVGATEAAARTVLDTWQAKVGLRGALTKVTDAGGTLTATARLTEARVVRGAGDIRSVPLALAWDVLTPTWAGTAHSDTTTLAGTAQAGTIANNGNATVRNPIITVTAAGSAITYVGVYFGNAYLTWSGTIAATKSLVIDCGAKSVHNDGVDAYNGFATHPSGHLLDDWMELAPGNSIGNVYRVGGNTSSSIKWEFSDGWS